MKPEHCSSSLVCNSEVVSDLQVTDSTGVAQETSHEHERKRRNLFLEIPPRPMGNYSQDAVVIKMPPTPGMTPKKVNFDMASTPTDERINSSTPGPSSVKSRSMFKGHLPKLGSLNASLSSDMEKAVIVGQDGSSASMKEKSPISRTLSLTKIFTPMIHRASSVPITSFLLSHAEATTVGCISSSLNSSVRVFYIYLRFIG